MWLLHKYKSFGRDAGVLFLVQILEALGMHSMGNKSKKKKIDWMLQKSKSYS